MNKNTKIIIVIVVIIVILIIAGIILYFFVFKKKPVITAPVITPPIIPTPLPIPTIPTISPSSSTVSPPTNSNKLCPIGTCAYGDCSLLGGLRGCHTNPGDVFIYNGHSYITIPNTTDTSQCAPLSVVTPSLRPNSVTCDLGRGRPIACAFVPGHPLNPNEYPYPGDPNEGCYTYYAGNT